MQYIWVSAAQHIEFCGAASYFAVSKGICWWEDFHMSRLW